MLQDERLEGAARSVEAAHRRALAAVHGQVLDDAIPMPPQAEPELVVAVRSAA
jgi:hypothetical protein